MNKNAQSIIEYLLIAVIVGLGIVFMGGYVLRSTNAHFKLWDEGVRDSFSENLTQAPVNDIPPITTNCECSSVTGSCGGPGQMCGAGYREVDSNCNIPGCNGASGTASCVVDNTCCQDTPVLIGCGSTTLPVPDSYFTPVTSGGNLLPSCSSLTQAQQQAGQACCPSGTCYTLPGGSNSCYWGYDEYGYLCGATTSNYCVQNTGCKMPQCTGQSILDTNSSAYCATSTSANNSTTPPSVNSTSYPGYSPLEENTGVTYVANFSDCPCSGNGSNCSSPGTASPCLMYCIPPYVLTYVPNTNPPQIEGCTLQYTVAASTIACSSLPSTDFPSGGPTNSCTPSTCLTYGGDSGCSKYSTEPCCYHSGSGWSDITVNNQSFQYCVNQSIGITAVTSLPYGGTATGCEDWSVTGTPTQPQTCDIILTYGQPKS